MQFQAPPQAGKYSFVMHLVCDSYIGMDSKQDVVLEVEDATKAVAMENEEDEISEPEEGPSPATLNSIILCYEADFPRIDSLAGQMNALKTGGLAGAAAPPKRKKKAPVVEESEEDESDTDGDAGDDDSETDTDTDSEDEDEKK